MWTKILTQLLLPPMGPLLLLAFGALALWRGYRRIGRASLAIGFVLLWGLATPLVANRLVRTLEQASASAPLASIEAVDAIVVLGGGLGPKAPPRQAPDLTAAADRVWHAARLYRAAKAPIVIAVGGYPPRYGDVPSEGASTRVLLMALGVPAEAIVIDESSLDTHENAIATAALLKERPTLQRVLLVTSALHMPRALATFRAAGIDAVPAPTDFLVTEGAQPTVLDWLPGSGALDRSRHALHEWLGRAYYSLRGWTDS